MNKAQRKNGESIFADGGYFKVGVYSIVIAAVTLFAFLWTPVKYLSAEGMDCTVRNIINVLADKNLDVLACSQTLAFCTLAMAEVFHAIGMRDTETSIFKFNHLDNKVMLLAVAVGVIGQVLVTEVPFMMDIFGTVNMNLPAWGMVTVLGLVPLFVHEIIVIIKKMKK